MKSWKGITFRPKTFTTWVRLGVLQFKVKVIALKGAKQVGAVTSTNHGSLITLVSTIDAIGNTVPSYFISPRSRFVKESMLAGAPVSSVATA